MEKEITAFFAVGFYWLLIGLWRRCAKHVVLSKGVELHGIEFAMIRFVSARGFIATRTTASGLAFINLIRHQDILPIENRP
jgi:hypothetical protein